MAIQYTPAPTHTGQLNRVISTSQFVTQNRSIPFTYNTGYGVTPYAITPAFAGFNTALGTLLAVHFDLTCIGHAQRLFQNPNTVDITLYLGTGNTALYPPPLPTVGQIFITGDGTSGGTFIQNSISPIPDQTWVIPALTTVPVQAEVTHVQLDPVGTDDAAVLAYFKTASPIVKYGTQTVAYWTTASGSLNSLPAGEFDFTGGSLTMRYEYR